MHTVSGKRVVWVVFGGIALLTGLAVYWFMTHAAAVRRGAHAPTRDVPAEPTSPTDTVPAR